MKNNILTILLITFSIMGILLMFFGILGLVFAYVYTYSYKMGGSYTLLGIGLLLFLVGFTPLIKSKG